MNVPETYFSVSRELALFGISCATGAVIGVCYDLLRAFRMLLRHNRFFIFLEDLCFLVCWGIFFFSFSSAEALGYIRLYFVFGNILGFALYFFTVGRVVVRFIGRIVGLFVSAFAAVRRIFIISQKSDTKKSPKKQYENL